MKKFLMHYFLWLTVLLTGGVGQLYAHRDAVFSEPVDAVKQEQESFHTSLQYSVAVINYTTQHFEKQQETIEFSQNENEEEELSIDKLHLNKKYVALNKHFLASYYANEPGLSYESLVNRLPSGKPFHSLSSRQYILFRVIRI